MAIWGFDAGNAAEWFANILSVFFRLLGIRKPNWKNEKKKSRIETLRNAIFASEYIQKVRTDKAILHLNTRRNGRITGTYKVLYELNPNSPHNTNKLKYDSVEEFDVSGVFLYEKLILVTFENKDNFNHHAGSFLLEINNNSLYGKYIVYYPDVPLDRKEDLGFKYTNNQAAGEIEFWSCSKEQAEAFIRREVSIATIKGNKRDL